MKKCHVLYLFLLYYQLVFCQDNNNLVISENEYKTITEKIDNDISLSNDTIYRYILKLSDFSNQKNNPEKESEINFYLAKLHLWVLNIELAKKHNDIAFELNKNKNNLAKIQFLYSKIFMRKSDFVKSYKYAIQAIESAKKAEDYVLIQNIYSSLAMNYYLQDKFQKAIQSAENSLAYQKKKKNLKEEAYAYGVLGINYWELYKKEDNPLDFKKSDSLLSKSFFLFRKENDLYGQAWALSFWSIIFERSDLIKCLNMKLDAEKKWKECKIDNYATTTNLGNIGLMYAKIADQDSLIKKTNVIPKTREEVLRKAEEYYLKCLDKTLKYNNKYNIQLTTKRLAFVLAKKGEFEKAYYNLKHSFELSDSLFSQENKNKIASLESAREIALKNKEIKFNQLKAAAEKKQKYFLLFGLTLILAMTVLLLYENQKRKKVNQKLMFLNNELDQANKAKARFFSILNHDLRGPVANLIFFLQLQKESPEMLDEESIKRMQDKTMHGAENLLHSMEDILQWSKSQMENFKPQPSQVSVNSLFEDTQKHFLSTEQIRIEFENPNNLKLFTDENYLKTILRNLTGNAIKALEGIENPTIKWKAWQSNNQTFLSVTDNGKGASQDQFKALYDEKEVVGIKSGLGLHLIRDLAKAIDCEISVDSKIGMGTTFILKL
ncbi:HAMP domain-containing histidine kinase [Flavobacterium piscinae]|uniref:histidine kinase n=1 Tax=Flavobacterium piscinae TaxID=2506424 RepID=A0A4Q1KYX7_9FLAO|nr:HAMP domain-containing sensor histidine kinase [Flavobacterium piscinae]RXR35467.1 HAMP domain-containing histidine kinase [Flavobacterium piscinae]